jgi:hypothetical protein
MIDASFFQLTVVDLRDAVEAERGRLPRRRQAQVPGDDHRAIDGDVILRRRRRLVPVPQTERHLHG